MGVVGHAIHHLILEGFLGTLMGCSMAKDWSIFSMASGSMVTSTPPMLMVFIWPTFPTLPKSVSLVITTLAS